MQNGKNYLLTLLQAIECVFKYIDADSGTKEKLIDEMNHFYLTGLFAKMESRLDASGKTKFKQILDEKINSLDKLKELNSLLTENVDKDILLDTEVSEIEYLTKKLIKEANETLEGEQREKFLEEINKLFAV